MELTILILVAIGLSIDSFAVSISCGLILNDIKFKQAFRIAFFFALFQAVMPIIGWFIGTRIQKFIMNYDHWVAFGLLLLIGGRMIWESFSKEKENKKIDPLHLKSILQMSVATSIDALVVGISLAFNDINIILTMFIIGITTGILSMLGILFGKVTGLLFGKKMEILGGIILIFIGLKILYEHLSGMA